MKEFKDIFPKTDFAMDAVISAAVEESANLDQEHSEALFVTVISGVAMMAGAAMNGISGQGMFSMDDAKVGHNLLIQSVKRFLPAAIRVAEDETEGLA